MRSKLPAVVGALVVVMTLAACGDDGPGTEGSEGGPRTIEITARDDLSYDPASIEVDAGEIVRFVVTNAGESEHEFVVGDLEMQELAEEQAIEGMHGHVEAMASLALEPGETAEATLTFDEAGEFLFACHLTGHYDGGMVGTITVT